LAYFVRPDDPTLSSSLEKLRQGRLERFEAMAKRLREVGLSIEDKEISRGSSLGRRHLAKQLIETQQVRSTYEAFSRYLCHPDLTSIPKAKLAIDEAIATVKNAGGISSWAHPPGDVTMDQVRELQSFGLDALECEYPWSKPSHGRKLRAWAAEAGLSITGGTDCHGPQPNSRAIGSRTIRKDELAALRSRIR
jgi:predicted metal-dependent phosphoesterase TrpH